MLVGLQKDIDNSQELLDRASRAGMEVSEAVMEEQQARAALTKARVTVHSFDVKKVSADIEAGRVIAAKNKTAALKALGERDYRRMGLIVSLVFIFGTLVGLKMYIGEEPEEKSTFEEEDK